jgi:hypothetical protein
MPRGAKRDLAVTLMLFENGFFLDKRSFVSMDAHLYLEGEDLTRQRERIYSRDAGWCKLENSPECHNKRGSSMGREEFDLDHRQGGLTERCDCDHNLQVACKPCHRLKHVRPRFTTSEEKRKAEEDFNKLYGGTP